MEALSRGKRHNTTRKLFKKIGMIGYGEKKLVERAYALGYVKHILPEPPAKDEFPKPTRYNIITRREKDLLLNKVG